jgi:hypothetical protein
VADRADAAAGLGHCDPIAALGDALEETECLRVEAPDQLRAVGGELRQRALQRGELRFQGLAIGIDALLFGRQLRLGALGGGGQLVGLHHRLQDLVLERLDLGLGELDLLLHRLIFDVGLHRHELIAEFREASLVQRDVLFDAPAGGLVAGQALLRGRQARAGRFEPRVEGSLPFGILGEAPLGGVDRGIEFLERDEAF